MNFQTEAHVDEYVIDSDTTASFSASDGELTYTRPHEDGTVSIPVSDATNIEFDRNTTLHRHTFLGVFFLVLSLVLTVGTVVPVYLGHIETRNEIALVAFLSLFAIGGWSTTYDYLSHSNRDVIDIYITTEEETHVLCGAIGDTEFVDACGALINSDISTTNHNPKLEGELEQSTTA